MVGFLVFLVCVLVFLLVCSAVYAARLDDRFDELHKRRWRQIQREQELTETLRAVKRQSFKHEQAAVYWENKFKRMINYSEVPE